MKEISLNEERMDRVLESYYNKQFRITSYVFYIGRTKSMGWAPLRLQFWDKLAHLLHIVLYLSIYIGPLTS